MLTVMAGMSLDDGFVMQIHPGAFRNHNPWLFDHYGRDKGADIPTSTDYVHALRPLLGRYGNEAGLTIILFTLDETSYARELAPLAGHYPALKLGPARSEEHTSELQSLMRISYAVFCLKKKQTTKYKQ